MENILVRLDFQLHFLSLQCKLSFNRNNFNDNVAIGTKYLLFSYDMGKMTLNK